MKNSINAIAIALLGLLTATMSHAAVPGPALSGIFSSISAGSVVNLSTEGEIDWVHWGLFTETSLDRKAGVIAQISDFTLLDASNGYAYVYQYADNANSYGWFDGTPNATVTNTTTGVWAYGVPQIGSGFRITAPADTATRTLKVYVGAYGARGKFEAFLSDASAAGYTNTSLFNVMSGPSGVYTLNYAAASAGQQMIVRWTLTSPFQADGNVTLQSAALTSSTANNPPYVALTNPPNNAKLSAGNTITLQATASDLDGTIAKVEFYADSTKLGEDLTSPYSFAWSSVPAGAYVLTARALDNQGAASVSPPVEIFVNGSGGTLAASKTTPATSINLTTDGSRDWAHWGLATNSLFNHKASVVQQISDYTKIGTNTAQRYTDNYTAFAWSDGTPTASVSGANIGVYTTGVTNGFEITVPADTNSRTLKVYVGLYGAQGNFQVWLSDFSAAAFTDTSLSNYYGSSYGVYTITYSAASAGQSLKVRYRSLKLFDQDYGNVTLQAATLVVNSTGNTPPLVQITSPTNGTVLTAPASFTVSASASDSDGTINQVEFFNGSTSLGVDSSSPYSVSVSSLAAGNYTLSAVATDNSGAKATNSVSIIVNNPPTASITSPTNGASFAAPATITIAATASDSDGSIAKAEFYQGATKLGEDTTSPYSLAWSNVSAGSYTLSVKAIDDHGAVGTSAAISINVTNLPPPPVTIFGAVAQGDALRFSFATELGRSYWVERAAALPSTNWQTITNLSGTGTNVTVRDASALPIHFYRVGAQ